MGLELIPGAAGAGAPVIYLLGYEGDDAGETIAAAPRLSSSLVVVPVERWDEQMSPWPARSPYGRGGDFPGGGPAFLDHLLGEMAPAAEEALGGCGPRGVAGYSLAGLFSLWALLSRPHDVAGAASCSGSLWFPGWDEWLAANASQLEGHVAYLSVGSRESRVKNPLVAQVGRCTDETARVLADAGAEVRRGQEPGGHFTDVAGRLSRGLAALDAMLLSCSAAR